jgi:hypothetical protein
MLGVHRTFASLLSALAISAMAIKRSRGPGEMFDTYVIHAMKFNKMKLWLLVAHFRWLATDAFGFCDQSTHFAKEHSSTLRVVAFFSSEAVASSCRCTLAKSLLPICKESIEYNCAIQSSVPKE